MVYICKEFRMEKSIKTDIFILPFKISGASLYSIVVDVCLQNYNSRDRGGEIGL